MIYNESVLVVHRRNVALFVVIISQNIVVACTWNVQKLCPEMSRSGHFETFSDNQLYFVQTLS